MLEGTETLRGAEYSDVLETIRMFAHDKGWVNRLREAVDTGLTAEAAVERVQNDNRARMMRTPDPYLRERMHDLDDLANRLMRILTGAGRHRLARRPAAECHRRRAQHGPCRASRL